MYYNENILKAGRITLIFQTDKVMAALNIQGLEVTHTDKTFIMLLFKSYGAVIAFSRPAENQKTISQAGDPTIAGTGDEKDICSGCKYSLLNIRKRCGYVL